MKLPERQLYMLEHRQMRLDELKEYIKQRRSGAERLARTARKCIQMANQAEKELRSRPKTKTYKPGLYWGHTAYSSFGEWVDGKEELIIVDHEGSPWMWNSSGWWRFGKTMNDTSSRIWERIGDL